MEFMSGEDHVLFSPPYKCKNNGGNDNDRQKDNLENEYARVNAAPCRVDPEPTLKNRQFPACSQAMDALDPGETVGVSVKPAHRALAPAGCTFGCH